MSKLKILWADDEIDLLRAHIMFIESKGYEVTTVVSGADAIDEVSKQYFDIVFLDENMPGIPGLEALTAIKSRYPNLPVVMITKNEEEAIMEDAIGSKISDYLIKPVNPNQILLCLKKNLDHKKLQSDKASLSYQQQFRNLSQEINERPDFNKWMDIYRRLVFWELELEKSDDGGIRDVLNYQWNEANAVFSAFIERNYQDWLQSGNREKPVLSHTLLKEKIFPQLNEDSKMFFILIDNLRYDQWKTIQPFIEDLYHVEKDELYYGILPTTTQFARNALFAGLLPTEIEKKYPKLWLDDDDEGTKNQFEEELLSEYLKRYGKNVRMKYHKILNLNAGKRLLENLPNLLHNQLNVIVYNFVDMLSHARTEMEVIRELAQDEKAYRSITASWFEHSPLFEILRFLASKKIPVCISTDHGSIKVDNPVRILGDKNTNTNLRFKYGKNLQYNNKEVFEIKNTASVYLPRVNLSTSYVFCRSRDFFVYPNNYNHFANFYRNTFQHGGVSLEEILIPFVSLIPR